MTVLCLCMLGKLQGENQTHVCAVYGVSSLGKVAMTTGNGSWINIGIKHKMV